MNLIGILRSLNLRGQFLLLLATQLVASTHETVGTIDDLAALASRLREPTSRFRVA